MLQLQSCILNLHKGDYCLMTSTSVDDQQLLCTEKMLKKLTNISWLMDDCQLVGLTCDQEVTSLISGWGVICPDLLLWANRWHPCARHQEVYIVTAKRWDVNSHTTQCTVPISVVSQHKLVSSWGLQKQISATLYAHVACEGFTYVQQVYWPLETRAKMCAACAGVCSFVRSFWGDHGSSGWYANP